MRGWCLKKKLEHVHEKELNLKYVHLQKSNGMVEIRIDFREKKLQ